MEPSQRPKRLAGKPDFGEVMTMRVSLAEESDRGAAVQAFAYVEDSLSHAVREELPGDVESLDALFAGPLHFLKKKLGRARTLGVVTPDIAAEIQRLADIRDRFGHARARLTFEEPSISRMCDALLYSVACRRSNAPYSTARSAYEGSASLVSYLLTRKMRVDREQFLDLASKTIEAVARLIRTSPVRSRNGPGRRGRSRPGSRRSGGC